MAGNCVEQKIQEKPLITFILFAYNQECFIRDAIEGALSQTYSPLEIILSDDCSTDSTFLIMKEMVTNYNGQHKIVINQNENNIGLCAHINRCVELSQGELLVGAAGDDVSLPERWRISNISSLIMPRMIQWAVSLRWAEKPPLPR